MAETLKMEGASEWTERVEDGWSPEQRKEKGQMDFVAEGILREVEQKEMQEAFEGMGSPDKISVAELRDKTDFKEAPRVNEALKEITAAAEQYARENDASIVEGLEYQLGQYEKRIKETESQVIREEMVDRAAWNSVLIEGVNNLQAEQAAREAKPAPNALPRDVL